ncbi:MAG: glycosyltransferase [Candidatus Eremiobacteraeota bacterium]|nr:glycosyltransferase [Candidatus Eremiobacteraeota bacterium]
MTDRHYAVVVGFDYHARYLARVMNLHSSKWRLEAFGGTRTSTLRAFFAVRRADLLISFGGPGPSVALAEAALGRSVPVLVVWAGSDVLIAAENPFDLAVTKRRGYENVAVAPWLVDELATLGITASPLAVGAVRAVERIAPFPKSFRVLTYLPEPRRIFYGEERVYAIARQMPEVQFTVLGPGRRNASAPPNVSFTGYVDDVPTHIDESAVLLRLTQHDGASILVLEALARGRHVVWTHDCPGVCRVADTAQALSALNRLYERHCNGELEPNTAGHDFVRDNFAPKDVAQRFEAHIDRICEAKRRGTNGRRRRQVAVSGLGLFSAEVAKHVERLRPDWKASVLSTNSRIEVLAALFALLRSDVWYSIGSPITDRWVNLCARIFRKPRVIHWVGSDIEYFRNSTFLHKQMRSLEIKHLTEVSWTADELRELGLQSDIVPLPLRHTSSAVKPLPDRFTIMLYLPKSRPEFYGRRKYEALLKEFAPEGLRVFVVGGGDLQAPEGVEVVNVGWRDDLSAIFEQVTVLIRLTPRDGLSLMVLEALSFGRYVMWTKPFPYCIHVRSREELTSGLRSLLDRHRSGDLRAQYAAAEMVERNYSAERAVDGILQAWESVR